MPQLDIVTFFLQIFATFLSFWSAFLYFRLFILPELYILVKQKQNLINYFNQCGYKLKLNLGILKLKIIKLTNILINFNIIQIKNIINILIYIQL